MIDENVRKEIIHEANESSSLMTDVRSLDVDSSESFALATKLAIMARGNWKRLDERRTAVTKPILVAKRAVDELFAPALRSLKEIEETLKAKIGQYTQSQRIAATEAMVATAGDFAAGLLPSVVIPEAPIAKGVSVKEVWTFEIINPAAVPPEYCSPDPAKIQAAIWYADTPNKEPVPIPGVRFSLRVDTVVRVK